MEKLKITIKRFIIWTFFSVISPLVPIFFIWAYDFIVGYPFEFENLVCDYLMAVVAIATGTFYELIGFKHLKFPFIRICICGIIVMTVLFLCFLHGRFYVPALLNILTDKTVSNVYIIGFIIILLSLIVVFAYQYKDYRQESKDEE